MNERWRQRDRAVATLSDHTLFDDGTGARQDVVIYYSPEDIERIRQGRLCLRCQEPQEAAFPEVCAFPFCEYPIRERQLEDFAKEYEGEEWVGPKETVDDEIEQMREDRDRMKHVPGSSIVVPGWAKI